MPQACAHASIGVLAPPETHPKQGCRRIGRCHHRMEFKLRPVLPDESLDTALADAVLTVTIGCPVFSGNLITLEQVRACQPVFSAALTGYVEAARNDDTRKNQICPANRYPGAATDWMTLTCTAQRAEIAWATDPDVSSWMQRSRLNATCGLADHQDDPQMKSALGRLFTNIEPAISNLEKLIAQTPASGR